MTYSGYAHFDSDEFTGWIGELGQFKRPDSYGAARKSIFGLSREDEVRLRERRGYGNGNVDVPGVNPAQSHHEHFGFLVASCDHADLRPLPTGVMVYENLEKVLKPIPNPEISRREVIDEIWFAVRENQRPLHCGEWARATVEVCNAILESADSHKDIQLENQVAAYE